jgi:CspA family cold shock protein
MTTGTIKFFNASKGFGFVTPDGGGADIFLPAATVTALGVANVSPGQRVIFEQGPDKKGPKVVTLQLLEVVAAKAPAPAPERVTVYCDPASDTIADVLSAVRATGYQLQLLDYITTPPSPDQLRHLSHLLSGSGKSLVRRADPLFSALQLDDRFIADQDFWTTVAEHPTLINGPVLVLRGKARVCKSAEDAKAFLNPGSETAVPKPKTLSPRIAALIRGEPVAAMLTPNNDVVVEKPVAQLVIPPAASSEPKTSEKTKSAPQPVKSASIGRTVRKPLEKPTRKAAAKPRPVKAKITPTKKVRSSAKKPKK